MHVYIDDCARLAYAEALNDDRSDTVCGFLKRAIGFFEQHGIHCQRLMTDNVPAYRSHAHAALCRHLGLRHLSTQPYRPKTNGKAERFIRPRQAEWAYAAASPNGTTLLPPTTRAAPTGQR